MKPSNLMSLPKTKKPTKFRNKPCRIDGFYFPSKHEAAWYERLKIMREMGEILYFHRQVMFDLPGGTTCKVDFMAIYPSGRVRYMDAKGKRLASFIRNQKQVRALYGVEVEEV